MKTFFARMRPYIKYFVGYIFLVPLMMLLWSAGFVQSMQYYHWPYSLTYKTYGYGCWANPDSKLMKPIGLKYAHEIRSNLSFPEKERYTKFINGENHKVMITELAACVSYLLIGTIAFGILMLFRKRMSVAAKTILVVLSSLWAVEPGKYTVYMVYSYFYHSNFMFTEQLFLFHLNTPVSWFIIPALIGLLICLTVLFKVIPVKERWGFIIATPLSFVAGYLLWFYALGPVLLP